MHCSTLSRVAHRSVVLVAEGSSQRACKGEFLRRCSRTLSTTRTARQLQASEPARTRSGLRSFTTSACLQKKGSKSARDVSNADQASSPENPRDFTTLDADISQAHERLKDALSKLRSGGRFNHEVLEKLRVQPDKSSNTKVPLGDVAQVIPKGRTVHVIVGEKEHIKPVMSAIQGSDLSLTPQPDPSGTNPLLLEIKIPPPTAESRQNNVKEAVKAGERATTAIRDARAKQHKKHRAMQSIKTIRSDDLHKASTEMEKIVEKGQAEVKKIVDNARKILEAV